jgi:hypothetical protein
MKARTIFVSLVALVLVRCDWLYPPLVVRVQNSTGFAMDETRVSIIGEEALIGRVASAEARTGVLRPKSDSGMELSFKDDSGRVCRQKLDVWVDNGFGGNLDLVALSCQATKVTGAPGRPTRWYHKLVGVKKSRN